MASFHTEFVILSEELSYEYYYCYVLLSADNISVVFS